MRHSCDVSGAGSSFLLSTLSVQYRVDLLLTLQGPSSKAQPQFINCWGYLLLVLLTYFYDNEAKVCWFENRYRKYHQFSSKSHIWKNQKPDSSRLYTFQFNVLSPNASSLLKQKKKKPINSSIFLTEIKGVHLMLLVVKLLRLKHTFLKGKA